MWLEQRDLEKGHGFEAEMVWVWSGDCSNMGVVWRLVIQWCVHCLEVKVGVVWKLEQYGRDLGVVLGVG